MDRSDQEVWNGLIAWGRRRAAEMLRMLEGDDRIPPDTGGNREGDLLYEEIHSYFNCQLNEGQTEGDEETGKIGGTLSTLCQNLELDDFEIFCLVFVMLAELDSHFEQLFLYLNNNWSERHLKVEWAIRLYTGRLDMVFEYLEYFFPEGRLYKYLFEWSEEIRGSGLGRDLKLKPNIARYLLSSGHYVNSEYMQWYSHSGTVFPFTNTSVHDIEVKMGPLLRLQEHNSDALYIQIKGRGIKRKLSYAAWYADIKEQGIGVLSYQNIAVLAESEQYGILCSDLAVRGALPCIFAWEDAVEKEGERKQWFAFLRTVAAFFPILFILSEETAPELIVPVSSRLVTVEAALPDKEEQWEAWKEQTSHYEGIGADILERIMERYTFLPEEITEILERAAGMAEEKSVITEKELEQACRKQIKHKLKDWAVCIETDCQWDDLILEKEQSDRLREAVNQIKYHHKVYKTWGFSQKRFYGTGLSVLLSGPPGTGKTMAAQVLAGELGMELYKLQLPMLVSKYIGETEKNLKAIFQEGEKSQAVLFFDEADVLFSKRTEVKDSHDKYSNMEAAYMLQCMEEYPGVVILATNFPQNIDEAFKRRLTFTIEFYMPDSEQRYQLWKKSFPEQLPMEALDIPWLAEQFELSGSNIKNIALNAAFLAAAEAEVETGRVTMNHVLRALRSEYRKSGTKLPECSMTYGDKKNSIC